jgi:hypothetical protein
MTPPSLRLRAVVAHLERAGYKVTRTADGWWIRRQRRVT